MKLYLEMQEILNKEEMLIKQPQQIRIEVISKEEAIEKLPLFESLFIGKNYIKRLHKCQHEEGLGCEVENL